MTVKFFLVTSDHFSDRLWFRDNEDFRVAMNYVAVVSYTLGANVLTFILMSNHVHFMLECTRSQAKLFADRFKTLYGRYYSGKYGSKEYFRLVKIDIREVYLEDESLKRAIAYVIMNSVAANICAYPNMYPWGTGDTFFNAIELNGRALGELSYKTQCRLIRSNVKLPSHYRLSNDNFVLPSSYIPVKFVESVFRSANSFRYFLNNSSKARKHLDKEAAPSFRDQIISESAKDLCYSLFRAKGIEQLNQQQMSELLRQLRFRFSADVNQLARVMGISYSEASDILNLI
ncbi:MAG: hypothetical protein IJU68_05825 [Bacteroidales bacterium]|nr:hypothetical protein [Bacteroidales bacterium]